MHVSKQLPCPSQPGLYLIQHQQHVVRATNLGNLAEIPLGRNDDARLALDRLNQKGACLGCNCTPQRVGVTEWYFAEARSKGSESIAVLFFGRESNDGYGAAVKVVIGNHDLLFTVTNSF